MIAFARYVDSLASALNNLIVTDRSGSLLTPDEGLAQWCARPSSGVSKDLSYEDCFAVPLSRFADAGDILVTISSSGNSPNIIRAIDKAHALALTVITVSGMQPDNRSRALGELNFYVPAKTYGLVEAAHQVLLHCWLDRFMAEERAS